MYHVVRNIESNKILIIFRIFKILSSDRGKCMFYLHFFFPFCGIFLLILKNNKKCEKVELERVKLKVFKTVFFFLPLFSPSSNSRRRCFYSVYFSLYLSLFLSLAHQNQAVTLKTQLLIQTMGGSFSFFICCLPCVCDHKFVECLSWRRRQCS